jgi:uncharacterized membrane protein YadS
MTAIAALGMKTSLKAMADVADAPLPIVLEKMFLAIFVLAIVVWRY